MSSQNESNEGNADRRAFIKGAAAVLAGGLVENTQASGSQATAKVDPINHASVLRPLQEKEKLARIASNSWPIRYIFKTRTNFAEKLEIEQMKRKYGEITMLDFPDFTRKTFAGVYHMDLFSGLFGDMDDDGQYVKRAVTGYDGKSHTVTEFDPSSAAGKKWLEKMANKQTTTGPRCQHISNNAPRDICDLDAGKRKAGIEVAKKWLDGAAILGAKSMRVTAEVRGLPRGRSPILVPIRRTMKWPNTFRIASNHLRRWPITEARWA